MNVFTIKDLENLSGIKAHTIRIWEQRYGFLKPNRSDTNIRYYCDQELKKILSISLLNKYGYKISHINKMSDLELRSKVISLSDKDAREERLVNELIGYMIDLDIEPFERTLDSFILTNSIDKAITRLIFPFLQRIGILWVTNHINPAQEHLVTNIIRQKLIVGIDGVTSGGARTPAPPLTPPTPILPRKTGKTGLLFLPEGEYHELGLLYVCYLLKVHGIGVIYLGADVPVNDIGFVCRHKNPGFVYTHLTGIAGNFNLEKFLFQAKQCFPDTPLIISGQLAHAQSRKTYPGVNFRRSVAEVLDFVTSL
jgi:MerR family transcriptional regulator, light-induced transcriptional regulator